MEYHYRIHTLLLQYPFSLNRELLQYPLIVGFRNTADFVLKQKPK